MNFQTPITISKRTALSAALCLVLGTSAQAADMTTATFTMFDSTGGLVPTGTGGADPFVTGSIGSGVWAVSSTTSFFGAIWTASGGTTFGPGTYSFDTSANNVSAPLAGDTYTNVVVGAGQVGGHILFAWGTTTNIDVVTVWDLSYDENGNITYTSSDGVGTAIGGAILANGYNLQDGIRGYGMADGAFPGFNANFDFIVPPTFAITLTPPIVFFNVAGQTVSTNLGAADYTFDWQANSSAAIVTNQTSANDSTSIVIDGSGLTAGQPYVVSVNATRDSDSVVIRADITITPTALTLSSANDSDGDGIDDATESVTDTLGNGIPDFLNHASLTARQLPIDTSDTDSLMVVSDSGVLALGATASSVGASDLNNGTLVWSATVTASDIGTTDDAVTSSCTSGCFDFKVTGLSNGATARVVVPLDTALGAFPVYRKFGNNTWQGFKIDDNNSISSAPASGTGSSQCPAPGSSAYSNVGLTPGDYCIQLTIQDGGPNDADGDANGTIVDPGGVATSGEHIMMADVPNGCSMSTTAVNPAERADWWLVAGFLSVLALLRGLRRKDHAA